MPAFGRKKKQQPELEPEPEPQAVDAPAVAQSASMALSQPVTPAATPSAPSDQFPSNYVDAVPADAARRDDGLEAEALEADRDLQDLVDAVTDCDLAKLDRCLNEANDLDAIVNEPFEDGATLLWLACQLGHRDVVDRLIAAGADVDGVAFGESTREHHLCAAVFLLQLCIFVHSLSPMPVECMSMSCDSASCGY